MCRTLNSRPNCVFFVKGALIMALLAIGGVIAAPGTTTPLEYTRRALEGLRQMNRDSLSPTDAQHHSAAMEAIENLEELLLVQGHSESEAGTYRLYLSRDGANRFWSDIDLSYIGRNLIIQNRGTTQFRSFERDPEHEGTWRARREGDTQFSVEVVDQRTFRMLLTYYTPDRNVNTPTSQYEAYYQMIDLSLAASAVCAYDLVSHSGGLPIPNTFDQRSFPQNLTLRIVDENHLAAEGLTGYPSGFARPPRDREWLMYNANIRIFMDVMEDGRLRLMCHIHDHTGRQIRSTEALYARRQ